MRADEFEEVLGFWFPDLSGADHPRMVRQFEWWFDTRRAFAQDANEQLVHTRTPPH